LQEHVSSLGKRNVRVLGLVSDNAKNMTNATGRGCKKFSGNSLLALSGTHCSNLLLQGIAGPLEIFARLRTMQQFFFLPECQPCTYHLPCKAMSHRGGTQLRAPVETRWAKKGRLSIEDALLTLITLRREKKTTQDEGTPFPPSPQHKARTLSCFLELETKFLLMFLLMSCLHRFLSAMQKKRAHVPVNVCLRQQSA
jgi:hypothetical protein